MQPQYTFHDTRLAVEAFSTTLGLGVRGGEEAKHATKLVTKQGCKKTVVGETSTNGLGTKVYQNFFHQQYSKKLSWTVKVVLHSRHYFTIIYNFSDTVLGDMWRQLLSSTIYTGLASPVQRQGESGGRRLKNKNSRTKHQAKCC